MPTRREKSPLKLPRLEKPTAMQTSVIDKIGQNQQLLGFLDLRPRAILERSFAEDRLEQPNEMKARETGGPSHCDYRKRLVLPISQQIACIAKSAQKFRANHRFRTTISVTSGTPPIRFVRMSGIDD